MDVKILVFYAEQDSCTLEVVCVCNASNHTCL